MVKEGKPEEMVRKATPETIEQGRSSQRDPGMDRALGNDGESETFFYRVRLRKGLVHGRYSGNVASGKAVTIGEEIFGSIYLSLSVSALDF